MSVERWLPVTDFPGYDVSDLGRVRSWRKTGRGIGQLSTPRIRKLVLNPHGYYWLILRRNGKSYLRTAHRLVLDAFRGPRPDLETRHMNARRIDNRLCNLQWGGRYDQFVDQVRVGSDTRGEKNGGAKFTNAQVRQVRARLKRGERGKDLAIEFGVGQSTITRIKKRVRYASVA